MNILNTTPWIEIDEKKYSPSQIVKYEKLGNKLKDIGVYGMSLNGLKKLIGEDIAENISLGFADSMADFSDKTIERILRALPNINNSAKCEISKKMYLDLIEKKKDKEPSFFNTADLKVLAKDGAFYSNTEIKYADKHVHNEENIKSNLIEIPYKKSTKTILNWLGVEKYKSNIIFESCEQYEKFDDLDEEINDIKIAVLTIITKNEKNIGKLKKIKIIPCLELTGKDTEQSGETITLEYFFPIEKEDVFYMKLPSLKLSDLRENDSFQSSIVDIFKQALMLELDQNAVENLVSRDRERKKKKIAEQYGSDAWEEAKKLLFNQEEINQPIYQFFKDNGLEENLYKQICTIDFSGELSSEETLIESLNAISKDIADLNELSNVINIDIRGYFVRKTKELIQDNLEKYRFCFYVDAKNKGLETQKRFLKRRMELENYAPDKNDFENSVSADENTERFLTKKFPELKNNKTGMFNIDDIYNKNASKVKEKASLIQEDFDDFIQKEPDYNSLLYFDLSDELFNEICQKLEERKREEKESEEFLSQDLSDNNVTSDSDKNASAFKTSTVERELEPRAEKQKRETTRTLKSKKDYQKRNRRNEEAGKKAEKIAYNELKKKYPNLIWHSENTDYAADRNNIPFEDGEKIICDMWNRDAENTYFEVKAATDEFIMSVNEYNSMKKYQEKYEVVLVDIDSCKISRHKFSELEKFKRDYDYIFSFQFKKED